MYGFSKDKLYESRKSPSIASYIPVLKPKEAYYEYSLKAHADCYLISWTFELVDQNLLIISQGAWSSFQNHRMKQATGYH